jgi:hypothetical protein
VRGVRSRGQRGEEGKEEEGRSGGRDSTRRQCGVGVVDDDGDRPVAPLPTAEAAVLGLEQAEQGRSIVWKRGRREGASERVRERAQPERE